MPKVSVIIPVYGVEKYIERCARSLFEQTLDDIEYLFIDDCTPDKSIEILKYVLEDYPHRKSQVIIHRMEQNSGQAKVREWGMRNATGEYLTHCDTDDWVDTTMYNDMYCMACVDSADMVCADFYMEKDDDTVIHPGYFDGDVVSNFLLRRNKCALWNKIIRTELFRTRDFIYPSGNMGEDMSIILQIVPFCNKVSYLNRPYYHYFINSASLTQATGENKVYQRYLQLKANVDIVINAYMNYGLLNKYENEFLSLKFHVKQSLEGLIKDKRYFKEWNKTYSEINSQIIFCPFIQFKYKINYIVKKYLIKLI